MNTLFPKEPNITNIISVEEGKIIDFIDGKTRNDTPEEYVRQNIEKKLVYEHKYPKEIIQIEFSIKSGAANRRVDIAIFPDDCKDFTPQKIKIAIAACLPKRPAAQYRHCAAWPAAHQRAPQGSHESPQALCPKRRSCAHR